MIVSCCDNCRFDKTSPTKSKRLCGNFTDGYIQRIQINKVVFIATCRLFQPTNKEVKR